MPTEIRQRRQRRVNAVSVAEFVGVWILLIIIPWIIIGLATYALLK